MDAFQDILWNGRVLHILSNLHSGWLVKLMFHYLNSEKYTILHWLALLTKYRSIRISTPTMKRGIEWLNEHFLPEIKHYDAIIGYRADDSYFSFARAFVNNEISLHQCWAMP